VYCAKGRAHSPNVCYVCSGDPLLSGIVQFCGERDEEERYSCVEQSGRRSGGIGDGVEIVLPREISTASDRVFYISSA